MLAWGRLWDRPAERDLDILGDFAPSKCHSAVFDVWSAWSEGFRTNKPPRGAANARRPIALTNVIFLCQPNDPGLSILMI
jgi:hypothetical protein